jgi:type II secretory pathway pseudopilin PulG
MLVAIIFMLAILILSMAVAIPRVRDDIRRDREVETMQRGKQYIRAVQLYYRKFGAYPPNIDALVKTNNMRFLRKKYVDPTTGKDEWKPVLWDSLGSRWLRPRWRAQGRAAAMECPARLVLEAPAALLRPAEASSIRLPHPVVQPMPGRPRLQRQEPRREPLAAQTPMEILQLAPALLALLRQAVSAPELPRRRAQAAQARQEPGPTARLLAAEASSASHRRARNSPSWSTKRRTTTTNGNFSTAH